MALRLFLNGCLVVSVLFFPWFFSLGFALLLLIHTRAYEVLVWGFMLDTLYGTPAPGLFNIPVLFLLTTAILFALVEFVKPRLVFYER